MRPAHTRCRCCSCVQVAVFDDAVLDPAAALLGLAAVPLGALADGLPVEGCCFDVIQPSSGRPAGRLVVSVAWHNPLAATGAGRVPPAHVPLLHPPAAAAAAVSPALLEQQQLAAGPQQQLLQQLLGPADMLAAMPLLAHPLQPSAVAGVSADAAAAVAAALCGSQQQQPPPLLLKGRPPDNPLQAFSAAAGRLSGSLQQQREQPQQLCSSPAAAAAVAAADAAAHRYGGGGRLGGADSTVPAGATYVGGGSSWQQALAGGPAVAAAPLPVMRHISPASDAWDSGCADTSVIFRVDGLVLSPDALADPALQHCLLAHSFLEDFTSPAQQCTATVPKGCVGA